MLQAVGDRVALGLVCEPSSLHKDTFLVFSIASAAAHGDAGYPYLKDVNPVSTLSRAFQVQAYKNL